MHEACRKIISMIIAFIMLIPGLNIEDVCTLFVQETAEEESVLYISVPENESAEEHICVVKATGQSVSMRVDCVRAGSYNRRNTSNPLCDLDYGGDSGFSCLKMTRRSDQTVKHIRYSNELAVCYIHRSDGEK